MQLGMIGLGRMGANMVRRLIRGGHQCMVFDVNPENVHRGAREGAIGTSSMDDLITRLTPPRAVWVMGLPEMPPKPLWNRSPNGSARKTSSSMEETHTSRMMSDVPKRWRLGDCGTWMLEPAGEPGDWSGATV